MRNVIFQIIGALGLRSASLLRLVLCALLVKTFSINTTGCSDYRARRHIAGGRHKQALQSLRRSSHRNPYLEAKALAGLERYEEAYEAALDEVRRLSRRSRGPVEPFLLAARLAHQLDYAQECLELLESARQRGPITPEDKIMEARRRLDRALYLLDMGGAALPAEDVNRAINLIPPRKTKTRSGTPQEPSGSKKVGEIPGFEDLPALAFRAWTVAASWAFAHNEKDKAAKWLSKPSTAREKKLVSGSPPAETIPIRRALTALLQDRSPSPQDALEIADLLFGIGALEAVVKTINTVKHPPRAGEGIRLLELGLKGARKTWNRKASWDFQKKIGEFALKENMAPSLRDRATESLAAECRYWEDPLAPSCRTIEHLAVRSGEDILLKLWIEILKDMAGQDKPFGHTEGFAERLKRADPLIRHEVIRLAFHMEAPRAELRSFLETKTARAEILRLKGEVSRSVNLLDRVLEENRWDGALRLELGFFALKYGDSESALAHLRWAQNLLQQEPEKNKHLIAVSNSLLLTALRLESGPAAVFHHLEQDALTWIHNPMSIREFEKRVESGLSEIVGPGHWPLGLIWLERLEKALVSKPAYIDPEDPVDEDTGKESISLPLRAASLKRLSEPLETKLREWMGLLFLKQGQPDEQSPLVARWFAWLPSEEHRKMLAERLRSAMQPAHLNEDRSESPDDHSPVGSSGEDADLILSAGRTCLRLAYYQTVEKTAQEKKGQIPGPAEARMGQIKRGKTQALKAAAKLATRLKPLAEKELRSFMCSPGPNSPTVWKARLLVLSDDLEAAKSLLFRAIRTGPRGLGLCRVSSVLSHLRDLNLPVENIAHHIAFSFQNEPILLGPAATSLAHTKNTGWAELAGQDFLASSPDVSRVLLDMAEHNLEAGNCDRSGKAGTDLFQWVSPLLPKHAPAVKLTVRIFARCNRIDRLYAQLEQWRANGFSRALGLVAKKLIQNGMEKEADEILSRFSKHSTAFDRAAIDLRKNPLHPDAVCNLARRLMERGIADQAIGLVHRNMVIAPEALCSYLLSAQFAIKHQSWGDAEDWLAWLIAAKGVKENSFPDSSNPLTNPAQLYLDLKHPEYALGLLDKTILNPSRPIKERFAYLESAWLRTNRSSRLSRHHDTR